jgi:O-6-methylguanine DNA methyltransferase
MDLRKLAGFAMDGEGPNEEIMDELLHVAHARLARVLNRIRRPRARMGVINTPLGELLVAESQRGLVALQFMDSRDGAEAIAALRKKFDVAEDATIAAEVGEEIEQLMRGDADAITHRRIDLSLMESNFQRRALKWLRQVPAGSVITYQGLAAAIGAPSSQRAIGNTVAANPVPIYVPCHRVIRSDGSIGNYGGGVERKLRLLRAEGFSVDRERRVPMRAVYGHLVTRIFCRPTCAAVKRADRKKWIIFADPERARRAGLRACKLCRPA